MLTAGQREDCGSNPLGSIEVDSSNRFVSHCGSNHFHLSPCSKGKSLFLSVACPPRSKLTLSLSCLCFSQRSEKALGKSRRELLQGDLLGKLQSSGQVTASYLFVPNCGTKLD
jgi:hypothetical protein